MIPIVLAILLLLCVKADARQKSYTLSVNAQGGIVAPVTAGQFAAANGLNGGGGGGGGYTNVVYTNYFGTTTGVKVYTNGFTLVVLSTNLNFAGVSNYTGLKAGTTLYTNAQSLLYLLVTNAAFTPNIDTRPLQDYIVNQTANLPPGSNYVYFTNNGPCTITEIEIDGDFGGYYPAAQLIFSVDGITSTCQYYTLFGAHFSPLNGHNNENLTFHTYPSQEGFGAKRSFVCGGALNGGGINVYTNVMLTFVTPQTTNTTYYFINVEYKAGPPVVTNYWQIKESQFLASAGTNVIVTSNNGVGQIEFVTSFVLGTNTVGFCETLCPALYLDNNSPISSFTGGSFYGSDHLGQLSTLAYANSRWGFTCDTWMTGLGNAIGGQPPSTIYPHGYEGYRFFTEGAYFNSNFYIVNLTGIQIPTVGVYSNLVGVSWYTQGFPPN